MAATHEEAADKVALACMVECFTENDEVLRIINDLNNPDVIFSHLALEIGLERLTTICNKYQEQPHLLDKYLESMIKALLEIARDASVPEPAFHQAFRYLYLMTKTRGAKYIVRLFPHEVADLEPILALLKLQRPQDSHTFATNYILLLWLSIICMIPFDLTRLDGSSVNKERSVIDRILETAKQYLGVVHKSRDAAAMLISKFVTRPDVNKRCLAPFLDWSLVTLVKCKHAYGIPQDILYGILSTLAQLFTHGKRDDLLKYVAVVLEKVEEQNYLDSNSILLKKLTMKVIQRLGLTLLKPRVASWRYQRGNRSLLFNLENPFSADKNANSFNSDEREEAEETYDIPEEIEQVLEQLLRGLRDEDTAVRWSAAKGIGRITGRLPKDLADDIIGSLLEFFSLQEADCGWHGGCLALAELGKRGLLLPERLPEVVPAVQKSLLYDEKHGSSSVGSNVRDAACYTCWSFARAYDPKELKDYVAQISSSLLIACIFDREVNCRRAASAAFQENVGRQGTFPHGIEIVTMADYFAAGNRNNCYLNLSVKAAKFPEYTQALIDHLAQDKISHWDNAIRVLSSQALYNLTPLAPQYMKNTILPELLEKSTSIDFNTRHGSIMAVAEITHAICQIEEHPASALGVDVVAKLRNIIPDLNLRNQFRGFAGDYMKSAACKLIEKLSMSKLPFHEDSVLDVWFDIIDECLAHTIPSIQIDGVNALTQLCTEFCKTTDGGLKLDMQAKLIDKHISKLKSALQFDRMGFALGLGAFPKFLLHGNLDKVLNALLDASIPDDAKTAGMYSEARRDAIIALTRIFETVGIDVNGDSRNSICRDNINKAFDGLLKCMTDYTVDDSRGDVGSWVRDAAMTGLETLTMLTVAADPSLITKEFFTHQMADQHYKTREHAGPIFTRMLYAEPAVPNIPHYEELTEIFPKSEIPDLYWDVLPEVTPKITQLLSLPAYRYSVLIGLTVSAGGLTESLVRCTSDSLLQYLRTRQREQLDCLSDTILEILKNNKFKDRIIIPLFKLLDLLLSNGIFDSYVDDDNFPLNLLALVKEEIFQRGGHAKRPIKLFNSVDVFCGLIQFPGEIRRKSLSQLMVFLCHKYPKLRRTTAEKLYTALLTFDDVVLEDNLDPVLSILTETDWDGQIVELKEQRNIICDLLGVAKPKPRSSATGAKKVEKKPKDELESYQDLVTRHGF
eukprot:gene17380-19119_t